MNDINIKYKVACMLLAQAEQELRQANNSLSVEINMFLQGVLADMEAK